MSQVLTMACAASTTKLIAATQGPSGVANYSQIRQLCQMFAMVMTFNGGATVVRDLGARPEASRLPYLVAIAVCVCAMFVLCSVAVSVAPAELQYTLTGLRRPWQSLLLCSVVAMVIGLCTLSQSALNGLSLRREMFTSQTLGGVSQLAAAIVSSFYGSFSYTLLLLAQSLFGFGVAANFLFLSFRKSNAIRDFLKHPFFDFEAFRQFTTLSGAALLTGLLSNAAIFSCRTLYLKTGGGQFGGTFDAAFTISQTYVIFLTGSLSAHFLPRYAAAFSRAGESMLDEFSEEVNNCLRVSILASALLISVMMAMLNLSISLLYSREFLGAREILQWMLVGDFFKLTGWSFGLAVIARADTKKLILIETVWQIVLVSMSYSLIGKVGLETFGIAYVAASVCHWLCVFVLCTRNYGVVIKRQHVATWCAAFACVVLSAWFATRIGR